MRTVIEGGWVVAWNGKSHEVHEQGSVVFEGDRVVHAGPAWTGTADARISARGKLVSPGFINTHVHTAGGGGDYLLLDMAKNDYRTANYMAFAAPLKGKMTPPPPEPTAALRAFIFLHALKNGTTTVIDVGGLRGDWEGYARLVDDLGVRVYGGPPFRDRDTYMDAQGRLYYEEDAAVGPRAPAGGGGLRAEVRRRGRGPAARALQRGPGRDVQRAAAAGRQGRGARAERADPHPRGRQPRRVPAHHGRVPQDADPLPGRHRLPRRAHPASGTRSSPPRTSGRAIPSGTTWACWPSAGATVGHCPYKYAKMAMTLHSFQRYLEAGVTLALGTDTFPLDIVSELRWASILAKVTDANYQAGLARDVFNAATARRLPLPRPRGPGAPGPGRQGRHPADQPGPRRRVGLRGSDQGAGRLGAPGATWTP